MNTHKIVFGYLGFLILFSTFVFIAGLFETTRLQSFEIGEEVLLNVTNTSSQAWVDYSEFKSSYVFTNEPAIYFLNFFGSLGFLFLTYYSWSLGRDSLPLELNEVFTNFSIILILLLYIIGIVFNYVINIFVDQLLSVLFYEIFSSIYMYQLLINWYWGFLLFSIFLAWLSNQVKYFEIITRQ